MVIVYFVGGPLDGGSIDTPRRRAYRDEFGQPMTTAAGDAAMRNLRAGRPTVPYYCHRGAGLFEWLCCIAEDSE